MFSAPVAQAAHRKSEKRYHGAALCFSQHSIVPIAPWTSRSAVISTLNQPLPSNLPLIPRFNSDTMHPNDHSCEDITPLFTRRDLLKNFACGFGWVAFAGLAQRSLGAVTNPL